MSTTTTNRRKGWSRPARAAAGVALAAALWPCNLLRGQAGDLSESKELVTPPVPPLRDWEDTRRKVEKGLGYLLHQQAGSGAIGSSYMVAVTSLAGLAVLGAGHLPSEEPYGKMLRGCLRYLEGARSSSGPAAFVTEAGEGGSRMHGHCYAVLFLCELYGSLPGEEERIASLVKGAVGVIAKAQSKEGGWYYSPENREQLDEASVTVCALQALRAAHNVGFTVDSRRIDAAVSYVKRCMTSDGSFCYSLSQGVAGHERTTYALSAAALSTLNAAGVYRSPELKRGFDSIRRSLAGVNNPWKAAESEHDFYANLYAAQALYQEGGDLWTAWYPKVRDHLVRKQNEADGSWESRFGSEYATAAALLILEVPVGYLPIFQR